MIDFKNDHGKVELDIVGDLPEICADTTMLITAVYQTLWRKDKLLALAFRYVISKNVDEGRPFEIGDTIGEDPVGNLREIIDRVFKKGE